MESDEREVTVTGTLLGSFLIVFVVAAAVLGFVLIAVLGFGDFSSSIPLLIAAVALLALAITVAARRGTTVTATPDALVFDGTLCRTPDIPWEAVAEIAPGQLGASLVLGTPVAHFPESKHVIFTCLDPGWRKRPLARAIRSRVAAASSTRSDDVSGQR